MYLSFKLDAYTCHAPALLLLHWLHAFFLLPRKYDDKHFRESSRVCWWWWGKTYETIGDEWMGDWFGWRVVASERERRGWPPDAALFRGDAQVGGWMASEHRAARKTLPSNGGGRSSSSSSLAHHKEAETSHHLRVPFFREPNHTSPAVSRVPERDCVFFFCTFGFHIPRLLYSLTHIWPSRRR